MAIKILILAPQSPRSAITKLPKWILVFRSYTKQVATVRANKTKQIHFEDISMANPFVRIEISHCGVVRDILHEYAYEIATIQD